MVLKHVYLNKLKNPRIFFSQAFVKTNLKYRKRNPGSSPRVETSKENQGFYTLNLLLFENSAAGEDKWPRPLFRPRADHACPQKPNLSRETVPLRSDTVRKGRH
jgi:hypothetical protein